MERKAAQGLGLIVAVLAIFGLVSGEGHVVGLNVDIVLDVVRLVLAGLLLSVGYKGTPQQVAKVLLSFGSLYIGIAIIGGLDRKLGGLLPAGLTTFDLIYHAVVGLAAGWLGTRESATQPAK